MSNPQENASVTAPDNEETVEAPETPAADEAADEAATPEESVDTPTPESSETDTEETPAESSDDATAETSGDPAGDSGPRYQEREALVAPDLSDLPDDIGDDFEKAIEATVLEFKEGDIVEGTIVNVDSEGALVDIGYKSEGFIPTRELSIRNNIDPEEMVSVGDRVESVVLDKEDDEGRLILSMKRALYERAWGRIQKVSDEEG
ncbi:MAG: S1 RNA-binding domain-containing protein, partial [Actinomycetota bacterium]